MMEHAEQLDRRPALDEERAPQRLEEAAERIVRDARCDSERYAEDTLVPKGGE